MTFDSRTVLLCCIVKYAVERFLLSKQVCIIKLLLSQSARLFDRLANFCTLEFDVPTKLHCACICYLINPIAVLFIVNMSLC